MCLITRQKKAKILNKDLKVYKSISIKFDNVITSYFQSSFIWHQNVLKISDSLIIKPRLNPVNNNGNDWFYADGIALNKYEGMSQTYYITFGFHACLTRKRCINLNYTGNIKEFLIPKGSQVFYDATGLIVSNQMMML